jgi:hypothetical protein
MNRSATNERRSCSRSVSNSPPCPGAQPPTSRVRLQDRAPYPTCIGRRLG